MTEEQEAVILAALAWYRKTDGHRNVDIPLREAIERYIKAR